MRPRQNDGVGDILGMIDQTAPSIAANKGTVTGQCSGLEIAEADRGHVPFVDAQNRLPHLAQQSLINRHVSCGRGGTVN